MKKFKISILSSLLVFNFSCANFLSENSFFDNEVKITNKNKKVDELLEKLTLNNKFMGSVSIRNKNKLIYDKSYGFSDISDKSNIKASEKTKYRIGSTTKVFTAVMIFQLIEEKKLTLNNTLSEFFPEIKNSNKITIEYLLNHRSGIHNFTNDESYLSYYDKPKTQEEIVSIISNSNSDFEPNKKAEYSNSNFVLLGFIIEKITKKDYKSNLNTRIINKLDLKNTYYGGKIDLTQNEAYSYTLKNNKFIKEIETDMSIPHGAGAIVSNSSDLTYFISALFEGKLVNSESLKEMKNIKDGYGKGLFEIPFYDKISFGHNGAIDGFRSMLVYFPDNKLSLAFTSNYLKYSANEMLIGILSFYYEKDYKIPSFDTIKKIELSPDVLNSYEGLYSSKDIPLKITTKVVEGELTAQATGQEAFTLSPISENEFIFEEAEIKLEFTKDKKSLTLKQNGNNIIFFKE